MTEGSSKGALIEPEARPRRLWPKVLIALLLIPCILIAWLTFERKRGQAGLRKLEKQLVAKGEKLTAAELIKPVPVGSKAADRASELLGLCGQLTVIPSNTPPAIRSIVPAKGSVVTKQAEWTDGDRRIVRWENIARDLEKNREVLSALTNLLDGSPIRHPIHFRGFSTLLPHLGPLKRAAQCLSISCLFHLHKGDVQHAINDLNAIISLADVTKDEPILISQLVRIAIVAIAINDCWAILQHDGVPEAELARLQARFLELDFPRGMTAALELELAAGRDAVHTMRSDDAGFNAIVGWSAPFDDDLPAALAELPYGDEIKGAVRSMIVYPMWRYAFSFEDERLLLQETQKLIDGARASEARRSAQESESAVQGLDKRVKARSWRYLATSLFVPAINKAASRSFRMRAQCQMAAAAIALKRFHMRHARYPETLRELVPDFVAEIPLDYVDGAPLHYRSDGKNFLLWSVGNNGKDDGGQPAERASNWSGTGKDMVWPQPASDQEVADYLEGLKRGK